jgi:hypothetical protein
MNPHDRSQTVHKRENSMSSDTFDRRSLLAILAGSSAACFGAGSSGQGFAFADSVDDGLDAGNNIQLQIIGSLGVGHIQSCLGFVGVIADSVSRDIYTQRQIDDLMLGTINGLELPKKMLRRLQETNISEEDKEFLDRMISVFNALQREANALIIYSRSRKVDDAQKFERDRRLVLKKLGDLTQRDDLYQPDAASQDEQLPPLESTPRTVPTLEPGSKGKSGR